MRVVIALILAIVCIWGIVCIATLPTTTDAGIVIEKRLIPAHLDVEIVRDVGVIETLHDTGWAIKVQDADRKSLTEWWSVSESMYNLVNVGDYVFREGGAICVEGVEE